MMKQQLDAGRPIQYDIRMEGGGGHSLVADGYREDYQGSVLIARQYHANYGQKNAGFNAWYTVDELFLSDDKDMEYMGINIYPSPALGGFMSENGTFPKEQFNYRYFVLDANGIDITFDAGQNLQFLPGVKVECTGGNIEFRGESSNETRLFSIKGMSQAEINIRNGGLKLYPGGGIKFYE